MRVIVRIEWGPKRWSKAVIDRGQTLHVGRSERAGLVVPHDDAMSGLHFALSWDGSRCELADLGSARGTILNGERISSGEVTHDDWIRAGATTFSVYFEGRARKLAREDDGDLVPATRKEEILSLLRSEPAPLYAVLDAARDERLKALLSCSPEDVTSLYDGAEGEELAEVAPYLVALPKDTWLLERLVREGWGRGLGIYLTSRRPFVEVRRQLRRLLLVSVKETSELLYFRFYEPRALAAALRGARGRQRQRLFGDAEAFVVEDEGDAPALVFRREDA
ncbi:DUF4123 domain-containing protein [Polyangium spumosum]|uniref:DUF4123 domain-containing protein n=1 Tax=Polyangium spumosum TaxID=889282 RepID=A0A6N7Q188_9BACT|nr:DUF4123 domain-containing protein [Polyangium spumosum]MRG96365.1 DUF4123 domain-containing protein [Polyangium spumosum]